MEGNDVKQKLFVILEDLIKMIFPDGKIKFNEAKRGILKVHLNELNSGDIIMLSEVAKQYAITFKRSGTGVTLLIAEKEQSEGGK